MIRSKTAFAVALMLFSSASAQTMPQSIPQDFPQFIVAGHESETQLLRSLFWLHYQPAGPLIPLWDEWMPMATLWPAVGSGAELETMRDKWAAALSSRP